MIKWSAQLSTNPDWIDTKARQAARKRNWALFLARGMLGTLHCFKGVLSPFGYAALQNVIRDTIWELEQQYPHSAGPKTISRRSF